MLASLRKELIDRVFDKMQPIYSIFTGLISYFSGTLYKYQHKI